MLFLMWEIGVVGHEEFKPASQKHYITVMMHFEDVACNQRLDGVREFPIPICTQSYLLVIERAMGPADNLSVLHKKDLHSNDLTCRRRPLCRRHW